MKGRNGLVKALLLGISFAAPSGVLEEVSFAQEPPPASVPPPSAPPPGSAPQAPPPAGNPSPPAGYPPPPAGNPPPPAGYPPPPAGYNQPPPGYYPPPPGYYPPPPGYYPPGAYARATTPSWRRGFLALPYLGIHSHQSEGASAYGPGARFGVLLGGRLNQQFSLNGEMTFDISNIEGAAANVSEVVTDLALSPLVHVPAGSGDVVFGPKLGLFVISLESGGGSATLDGLLAGANLGMFFPVSDGAALGGLLNFEFRDVRRICAEDVFGNEDCISVNATSAKTLAVTFAALF